MNIQECKAKLEGFSSAYEQLKDLAKELVDSSFISESTFQNVNIIGDKRLFLHTLLDDVTSNNDVTSFEVNVADYVDDHGDEVKKFKGKLNDMGVPYLFNNNCVDFEATRLIVVVDKKHARLAEKVQLLGQECFKDYLSQDE